MNRLKALRTEAKLSLRQLQAYVGIDFSRLAIIEKQDVNIESKTLNKLLDFFNVNYSYFNGGDGLINFYDVRKNAYYPIAYKQFENILMNANIQVSIEEGKVKRVLSDKDMDLIFKSMDSYTAKIEARIAFQKFVVQMDLMSDEELLCIKPHLLSYLDQRLKK